MTPTQTRPADTATGRPAVAASAGIAVSRVPATVDEVNARLIAAVVVLTGLVALTTQQWWLYAVLFADFALRTALGPRWSPVARAVAAWLRPRVAAAPRPTAFAPKRFAAGIGAVMTAAITALAVAHAVTAAPAALWVAWALATVMIVLPGLEALVGFCLGCRIFLGLMKVGLLPESVCVDCAPAR